MGRDNVYIFDKITFKRQLLGEIQTDFNMSFVTDGTKDSCSILVYSFIDCEIEPYSIIWHEKTNTWWTLSHDKIERHENENGFYYLHNLQLIGAIELFNARDLTDCAFNDKTYTVGEFIQRLFSLSNLEFDVMLGESDYNFVIQRVDFIKTFENYTLLSALREFLDAYNECGKLTFTTTVVDGNTYIDKAYLNILSKTGSNKYSKHDINDFDDVKETKVLDKNSFGTCVVSNANNVVSTQAKTYPSNGFKELSGTEYEIKTDNAVLRLPSNVYKVNWLKLIATRVSVTFYIRGVTFEIMHLSYDNEYSKNRIIAILDQALQAESISQEDYDFIMNDLGIDMIWAKAKEYHTVTFFTDIQYNPNDTYTLGKDAPYIPVVTPSITGDPQKVTLLPKEIRDCVQKHGERIFAMYWERGSNLIRGFEWLEHNHRVAFNYTDGYYNEDSVDAMIYSDFVEGNGLISDALMIYAHPTNRVYLNFAFRAYDTDRQPALFRINYIPMADLKLKVDNQRDKRDIHLYNQNGKLSDSYALSKLISSYAQEISSDSITRYAQYYDFDSVPKVGSFVTKGKDLYVINNISMTFSQNEDFGYYIECEITMSKWCSTKSAMVSPNTNIRDYGIPQQYNVKRKQVYRDYYELSYETYDDANIDEPYLTIDKVLPFSKYYDKIEQYISVIKIVYDKEIGDTEPSDTWYYQLDCSTLILNKQLVVHCDFMDNNIIGYSNSNRDFIFDVAHLFDQWSRVNVPISYTDDRGRFKDIELLFLNEEQKTNVDYEYFDYQPEPYDALMTQCFIPKELYDLAGHEYTFKIDERGYNKDSLEVPVFEYMCQIGDSEDVLIGNNILQQYEGCLYFYDMVVGVNGEIFNQNNVTNPRTVSILELEPKMELNGAVKIEYNGNGEIRINYYEKVIYDRENDTWEYYQQQQFPIGRDIAIFRHAVNKNDTYDSDLYPQEKDLLFICRNVDSEHLKNLRTLVLKTNHYKLK